MAMEGLKKLPLFIGLLIITLWGAHKKINLPIVTSLCVPSTPTELISYKDKLQQLSCLTTKNWSAFYDTARPVLPESVSDEELQFIYKFLQRKEEAVHFDKTASSEKRLEILLLFASIANSE